MRVGVVVLLLLLTLPAQALTIAMVLWRGETQAEEGFRDELARLGYRARFVTFNANLDRNQLATLLRQQLLPNIEQYDYVYTFGTTATLMAKSLMGGRKPLIFNVVSDPFGAGILSDEPGANRQVAGVSNLVPMGLQLENGRRHLPAGRRLLLPFNPREQNTLLLAEMVIHEAQRFNWPVETWRIVPVAKRLDSELARLVHDAGDAIIYLGADSYLLSVAPRLLASLNRAGIPTLCGAELFMSYGCSVGTISSYESLGRMAARIIDQHSRGTPLEAIPLQLDPAPRLILGGREKPVP